MKVRPATEDDLPFLLRELKNFSDFYGTDAGLFGDSDYAGEFLKSVITKHFARIAERDGEAFGLITGFVGPHIYNPNITVLTEMFWWVPEKYRGTRAGLLLLNEFVSWGKENVDWILFTLEDDSPVNPDCLERRGFKMKERSYIMEV